MTANFTGTPPNDQCAGAVTLTSGVTNSVNTANATSTGDPTPSCGSGVGKGVWYKVTPANSGMVTVSTCGSDYDTVLAIYTGSCGSLTAVSGGCDDDGGCGPNTSAVSFSGTSGTTYYILAGGFSGASGNLKIFATPSCVSAGVRVSSVSPSSWNTTSPISGGMTAQLWNESGCPNCVDYVTVGIRDSAGNWVGGEPQVILAGVTATTCSPGDTFPGRTFSGLAVPTTPGNYTVWAELSLVLNSADAISTFKSRYPTTVNEIERVVGPLTMPVQVTVQPNPSGRSFSVDGTDYTSSQTFSWTPGSTHTIATISPQSGGTGVQYVWSSWSDGGAMSHTVSPSSGTTYTANFTTQYYLTMNAGTGGGVSPGSGWYNSGERVSISATPNTGYTFSGWTGSGSGSYSGSGNPAAVTMNGPITETASFSQGNISVTVQPNPSGRSFTVDGTTYTNAQTFSWVPGSSHPIDTTSPQSGGTGIQYLWSNWSDGGAMSHTVSPNSGTNYTVNFTTQYYLTMSAGTGGSVSPSGGWFNSGASVSISATANGGYTFSGWTGSGSGSYSGNSSSTSVTMNGPITETADFTSTQGTTAYVTNTVLGTVRSNYAGFVGMRIGVGASPITVTALGRIFVSGNSNTHRVKLVHAPNGPDVAGGSVSLGMSGGTAGQFKYASLSSPVVLAAGATYYVVSQETFGGDAWCDVNTTVTTTSVATELSGVYGLGDGGWTWTGFAGRTYGPVNFQYAPTTPTGYVTSTVLGTVRNNYSGFVGMRISVGASPITVTALGRIFVNGNSNTHTIKLVNAATGGDVAGGSVSLGMSGGTAGQFKYANLSSPVGLAAGATYYVVSEETFGGDAWCDVDTTVTTTSVATDLSGVYGLGAGGWTWTGFAGRTYGPVNFQYAPTTPTSYVTSTVLGTVRNNYSGFVGMRISVGASPITVTALGRIFVNGNSNTHTIKLVNAATGGDVAGGSVSLGMSDGTPGQFKYASLSSPVMLAAGTTYYVVSQETLGGDAWCDVDTAVTTTPVATELSGVYGLGAGGWTWTGFAGRTYGPVNFQYATTPPAGYVTSTVLGTVRSNYTGFVGMRISVGASPITVTALGRIFVNGNSNTHTVKLVNAATGSDVAGGSVSLGMSGGTLGQFKYASLSGPVVLAAGATYYVVSQETSGGDAWCDVDSTVSTTSVATELSGIYGLGAGAWTPTGFAGRTYGPVDFQYATTPPPGYVTSQVLGTVRSNYTGFVGMRIGVGASQITVTALGRIFISGNSNTHTVKLVNATDGNDVAGGSVSLNMSGGTVGQFKYASLSGPVVLAAGATYYVVSQETLGGDAWCDVNTTVTTTSAATELSGVYGLGAGGWTSTGFAGRTYGPVDFQYSSGFLSAKTRVPAEAPAEGRVNVIVEGVLSGNRDIVFQLSGWVGKRYVVESSADLINWLPLKTIVMSSDEIELHDSGAANQQFYRLLPMPDQAEP